MPIFLEVNVMVTNGDLYSVSSHRGVSKLIHRVPFNIGSGRALELDVASEHLTFLVDW